MSYIVLQFGQCGNQLGNAFFSSLYNDLFSKECGLSNSDNLKYIDTSLIRWFNKTSNNILTARSILFDTEEKVISHLKCTELGTNTWSFSSENVIINNKGGCGNNWAAGYNESGPESSAKILEQIRKESEKCDNVRCFLTLGSAGGGTGSGVSKCKVAVAGNKTRKQRAKKTATGLQMKKVRWSALEKAILYYGLECYGPDRSIDIVKWLPGKGVYEIDKCIQKYSKETFNGPIKTKTNNLWMQGVTKRHRTLLKCLIGKNYFHKKNDKLVIHTFINKLVALKYIFLLIFKFESSMFLKDESYQLFKHAYGVLHCLMNNLLLVGLSKSVITSVRNYLNEINMSITKEVILEIGKLIRNTSDKLEIKTYSKKASTSEVPPTHIDILVHSKYFNSIAKTPPIKTSIFKSS